MKLGQARHGLVDAHAAADDVARLYVVFVALLLMRLRAEMLSRERTASWIREVVTA